MKVLVVDDSEAIRDAIKDVLTAHKYEVETADNGAQALDKYAKFKPDLVTLDLSMPIMDGYETLKRILGLDRDANVIMLTASEQYEALETCLRVGAIGYIVKPFTAKELMTGITNALRKRDDKNVALLFSLACNKIESSIKKIIDSEVSVILADVQVIRQEVSTQMLSPELNLSQIRVVPRIAEDLKIEAPDNTVGYLTEISGQQNGMIATFIQKKDLATLFNIDDVNTQFSISDQPIEFFHIINTKIISQLADTTHLALKSEPTRLYSKNDKELSLGKELTKAIFEIVTGEKRMSIEIQLWFSTGQIFRRL